jgi:hypothetical protein
MHARSFSRNFFVMLCQKKKKMKQDTDYWYRRKGWTNDTVALAMLSSFDPSQLPSLICVVMALMALMALPM